MKMSFCHIDGGIGYLPDEYIIEYGYNYSNVNVAMAAYNAKEHEIGLTRAAKVALDALISDSALKQHQNNG